MDAPPFSLSFLAPTESSALPAHIPPQIRRRVRLKTEAKKEIVFGVAEAEQIGCPELRGRNFCELWVKADKNESIYGNDNTARMRRIVSSSDVFRIFGCSLGDSDSYIWHEVGKRFTESSDTFLVLFAHGMPDRSGQQARLYQRKRDETIRKFEDASDIDVAFEKDLRERTIVMPSSAVFRHKIV